MPCRLNEDLACFSLHSRLTKDAIDRLKAGYRAYKRDLISRAVWRWVTRGFGIRGSRMFILLCLCCSSIIFFYCPLRVIVFATDCEYSVVMFGPSSFLLLVASSLLTVANASLNCTVANAPIPQFKCPNATSCPQVGEFKVGDIAWIWCAVDDMVQPK